LTSVTDDHERNHALIADGAHFRLSPAFDLVPKPSGTQKRYLALTIGDFGALAIRENLLSSAAVFELTREHANNLIDEVQQTIRSQWQAKLEGWEVSRMDIERITGCFDPPSFESPPPGHTFL
jgi:serine/threonine-protein kinase HipA